MNQDDLKFALDFIDTMASRGAIKGSELYYVGLFRSKIESIISEMQEDGIERKTEEPNLSGEVSSTED